MASNQYFRVFFYKKYNYFFFRILNLLNDFILENDLIRYEFDQNGNLTSAYDKEIEKDNKKNRQVCNAISLFLI